jgi:hypothetical protein
LLPGDTVRLLTTTAHVEAVGLFEKLGFTLVQKSPYWGPLPLMHHSHGVTDLHYELR